MESNPLVPSDAVKAIQDSVKTDTITVNNAVFTTRPVFEPPPDATPTPLLLNTLSGIVEYVNNGADAITGETSVREEGLMIVVTDQATVQVVSGLFGRGEQRMVFAKATAGAVLGNSDFRFGEFYDCETFIIKLQALFADFDGRAAVLQVVGTIKEESVRNTDDDGVTQTVTARTGIARVGDVQVPNPVYLAPYRTFREITQPLSAFVLRMKKGQSGGLPTVALFEADGGKWKLDAINSIRDYLSEKISGVPIIA